MQRLAGRSGTSIRRRPTDSPGQLSLRSCPGNRRVVFHCPGTPVIRASLAMSNGTPDGKWSGWRMDAPRYDAGPERHHVRGLRRPREPVLAVGRMLRIIVVFGLSSRLHGHFQGQWLGLARGRRCSAWRTTRKRCEQADGRVAGLRILALSFTMLTRDSDECAAD